MKQIRIKIKKLPKELKEKFESGRFSFIDFLSNELNIDQNDIEVR